MKMLVSAMLLLVVCKAASKASFRPGDVVKVTPARFLDLDPYFGVWLGDHAEQGDMCYVIQLQRNHAVHLMELRNVREMIPFFSKTGCVGKWTAQTAQSPAFSVKLAGEYGDLTANAMSAACTKVSDREYYKQSEIISQPVATGNQDEKTASNKLAQVKYQPNKDVTGAGPTQFESGDFVFIQKSNGGVRFAIFDSAVQGKDYGRDDFMVSYYTMDFDKKQLVPCFVESEDATITLIGRYTDPKKLKGAVLYCTCTEPEGTGDGCGPHHGLHPVRPAAGDRRRLLDRIVGN